MTNPDSPHEEGALASFHAWSANNPYRRTQRDGYLDGYLSRNAEVERLREALQTMLDDWHSHGGSAITNARRALEGSEPNV